MLGTKKIPPHRSEVGTLTGYNLPVSILSAFVLWLRNFSGFDLSEQSEETLFYVLYRVMSQRLAAVYAIFCAKLRYIHIYLYIMTIKI